MDGRPRWSRIFPIALRSVMKATMLQTREPLHAQAQLAGDTSRLGVAGAMREVLRRLIGHQKRSSTATKMHARQN